jgi:hypothetical protein
LNYRQNVSIIDRLKQQVSNRDDFEVYSPPLEDIKIKPCPNLPQVIKQNLLTGKGVLVPRSKDIDCLFISLQKIHLS